MSRIFPLRIDGEKREVRKTDCRFNVFRTTREKSQGPSLFQTPTCAKLVQAFRLLGRQTFKYTIMMACVFGAGGWKPFSETR